MRAVQPSYEELEERLRAAEAASEAKSDLLAAVSHEMRTELSGILGMAQVALDTRLTPEQRDYLNVVVSGSDTLLTLVNDLLDAARMEAGRLDLEAAPFNLYDSLQDIVASLSGRAQIKGLDLTLNIDPGVPTQVITDPGRFRQIIANLVGNAIKFTEQGAVAIDVDATRLDGHADLEITISDTGRGIPVDDLDRIFEPFAQVKAGQMTSERGTGLGLSIVSQLVTLLDGTVSVESELGRGSAFTVLLPVELDEEHGSFSLPDASSELSQLPILVVSDNPAGEASLVETLNRRGMRPEVATDTDGAMDMLHWALREDEPFALAIVDLIGGPFVLSERIRHEAAFSQMHLVVVPAIGQRGDAARCRRLEIAGYLTRPLPPEDIVRAIEVVLAGPTPTDLGALVTRHWLRERRRRLSILVADDSPTNRIVATRMLETRGHDVTAVNDGREAIAKIGAYRFDLVLMDVEMPDIDGIQATAAIRAREENDHRLPIVGMTSNTSDALKPACLDAGMDALLPKPFDIHLLATTIEQLTVS